MGRMQRGGNKKIFVTLILCFFFFKQKTAYEIVSRDWSSDVCSSDLFILTISRCGSAPTLYAAQFLLRQRPRSLYCPFLVAAAPPLFILTNSRCGSAPAIYTDHFSLRQRLAFYTDQFSLRQRPRFLYTTHFCCGSALPFILTISRCGRSEEHTSELQSRETISYAVFCLKKKKIKYSSLTTRHTSTRI